MSAGHAARQDVALDRCQPLTDRCARAIASTLAAHEALAGLEDQCLDLGPGHAKNLGDLAVRVITQLEENQSDALVIRQSPYVIQHLAKVLTPLKATRWTIRARPLKRLVTDANGVVASTELRQTAVPGDHVQPGP